MERRGNGAMWTRRVLMGLVIAAILYLAWAIWDYEALMAWMQRARPLPFFVAMALLPAIGIPYTAFFLLAGATFGAQTALIGTTIALAVNLSLCYWIGRAGIRRRLTSVLARFGYELPDFDVGSADQSLRRTIRVTTLIKVAPGVPGVLKNVGLGAARVPFWVFLVISMLITGTYAIALIFLGESLFQHDLGPGSIAVLVVAGLGLGLWWWSRRQQRADRDAQQHPA